MEQFIINFCECFNIIILIFLKETIYAIVDCIISAILILEMIIFLVGLLFLVKE